MRLRGSSRSVESCNALLKVGSLKFRRSSRLAKLWRQVLASVIGAKYTTPSWVTTPNCVVGARAPASEMPFSRFRRCTKAPVPLLVGSTREWLAPQPMRAWPLRLSLVVGESNARRRSRTEDRAKISFEFSDVTGSVCEDYCACRASRVTRTDSVPPQQTQCFFW